MSYDGNEEFWFRFTSLSEAELLSLREKCAAIETRQKKNVPGRYVASFRLKYDSNYDWIRDFVRDTKIAESEYGLFVSLLTQHDSEIVTIPQFVLELYRYIGSGKIEFSFTVTPLEQ